MRRILLCGAVFFGLLGCPGGGKDTGDTGDTDADADADSDADADADVDTFELPLAGPNCHAGPAGTIYFTVGDTADTHDADLTDDLCVTAAGTCSLRAAVMQANATGAPMTHITLADGQFALSIPAGVPDPACIDATCIIAEEDDAAQGDLDVHTPVCFIGRDRDTTLLYGGGDVGRVFHVHADSVTADFPGVVMENLTIEDGYAPAFGGADPIGDTVTMAGCESGEEACGGGGIYNNGSLYLRHVGIKANASNGNGNGIENSGTASLWLDATIVKANQDTLGHGGGLLNNGGTVSIAYSTFQDNSTDSSGGGLSNFGGTVDIVNSTFSGNATPWEGSSLSNSSEGTIAVLFSTIGFSGSSNDGAAAETNAGSIHFRSSIVAANTAGANCKVTGTGAITTSGDNLADDGTCADFSLASGQGDLQALAFTGGGGWTPTLELGPASDAVDAATDCTADDGSPVDLDQRGVVRTAPCDLGAHEN